jgi:uncharacterized pyridoxal phosphate-containing UPF0001 family protein
MSIAENIAHIRKQLPSDVQLVCVSKFHPVEAIQTAYDLGERIFGESRAQELVEKQARLPKDIEWHFIGSLQTNKVKQVVPLATLIHSVDSIKLLEAINRYAENQHIIGKFQLCLELSSVTVLQTHTTVVGVFQQVRQVVADFTQHFFELVEYVQALVEYLGFEAGFLIQSLQNQGSGLLVRIWVHVFRIS